MAAIIAVYLALAIYLLYCFLTYRNRRQQYNHIHAVGCDNLLLSYVTAVRYLYEAPAILDKGYKQYKGRVFRVPQLTGWLFIVSGDRLIDELRNAPESAMSNLDALDEMLASRYTMGPSSRENPYHIGVIRSAINKHLGTLLPQIIDEVTIAFPQELEAKLLGEWTPIKVTDVVLRIVAQVTNRTFVGAPTCRIDEYRATVIQYATSVVLGAFSINVFPTSLKPFAGKLFIRMSGHKRIALKYLGPIIEERKTLLAQHGPDYPDKPHDALSWIMDAVPSGYHSNTDEIAVRMLILNFVALHTTSLSLIHALLNIASRPEYVEPLRCEVKETLGPDPTLWAKDTLACCWKLDSFLKKESQRVNGLASLALPRKVLRPYMFSDGSVVPAGVIVSAAPWTTHRDPENFEDPDVFDGFRFSRVREKLADLGGQSTNAEEEDRQSRLTATGLGYLAFGGGRHVCPGRFFAATELKCMLAYVLLNYDIKMRQEGVRPKDRFLGSAVIPDPNAEVMFRRRAQGV